MDVSKNTVRAVERALDILLCFTDDSDLSLTEIAARVDLHKSTVHRLLASLEVKGFVLRHQETERYRLGFRVWELAANLTQGDDPAGMFLPEMERLRNSVGETVSLYVRDGMERVRVQAVQSNQEIRRVATIGARMPLHVGASSKVLVAFDEPHVKQELLASDQPFDHALYDQQLGETRLLGYATSMEEREVGAAAVAAPILNRANKLVAVLAISGPLNRLTMEKMKQLVPQLTEFANRMGKMSR